MCGITRQMEVRLEPVPDGDVSVAQCSICKEQFHSAQIGPRQPMSSFRQHIQEKHLTLYSSLIQLPSSREDRPAVADRNRAVRTLMSEIAMLRQSSIHSVPVRQSADCLARAAGGNFAHRHIMTERPTR